MAYVTNWERMGQERGEAIGRAEGLLEGVAVALDLKFGAVGTAVLPELRQITDPAILQQVGERIKTATSDDELRRAGPEAPVEVDDIVRPATLRTFAAAHGG